MAPNSSGKMAPPTMAITSNEEPVLVNLPKSAMASGQIAPHIMELAKPIATRK
jgi:hypothetical protein